MYLYIFCVYQFKGEMSTFCLIHFLNEKLLFKGYSFDRESEKLYES